jgi:fatty acid desaturase
MSEYSLPGSTVVLAPKRLPITQTNKYAELKRRINIHGLLDKQPVLYTAWVALIFAAMATGVVLLFLVHNIWFQLLNAVFLGIVFAQIAYISHDAGHRQIYATGWKNDLLCTICSTIMGMGKSWWVDKHNNHHSHPNQEDLDPDLNIPFIFFSEDETKQNARSPFQRFMIRYQTVLFFPALCFVALDMKRSTFKYLVYERKQIKYPAIEAVSFLLHVVFSLGILLYTLGFWPMLAFIAVNQAVLGFILGSAFAPNHKGMPVLARESDMDFLHRQILTARNIFGHPLTDFWYGGLNYQIEHHLFPTMPRRNLKQAQKIVKAFCQEHDIDYAETTVLGSYGAIMQQLSEVSAAQKKTAATTTQQ